MLHWWWPKTIEGCRWHHTPGLWRSSLWRSGLCWSVGMVHYCSCLCSLWAFDFHVTIYISIATLWKCLSPPDCWSVVLLYLRLETSQTLCQLKRCVSSMPCPPQGRQNCPVRNRVKEKITKSRENEVVKWWKGNYLQIFSDFFLILFAIPSPCLFLS